VRDILHEAVDEVFNVDGKVFRTLRLLLTKPGFLTGECRCAVRGNYHIRAIWITGL
jgi:hypothetical protein